MREMDHRIWNEHHDQFSEWMDGVVAAAGARLRRFAFVPRQLVAGVAAFGATVLTFGSSIV